MLDAAGLKEVLDVAWFVESGSYFLSPCLKAEKTLIYFNCGRLLKCAYHRCRKPCHPSGQCEHCDQTCLKPRKPCLHPCPSPCHFPSSCPTDTPCPKVIEITCSCGTLTQKVKCGSCDAKVEGNKDKVLKCDDRCEVEKRNKRVAEALGVEVKEKKIREVEYDQLLLGFYANNVVSTFLYHPLSPALHSRRVFSRLGLLESKLL